MPQLAAHLPRGPAGLQVCSATRRRGLRRVDATYRAALGGTLVALLLGLPARAPAQVPGASEEQAAPPEAVHRIAPERPPGEDRAIEERLRAIFARVEGLEAIRVEARSGVVELSGEIFTSEAGSKAVRIAEQIQGVVEVQSEFETVRDLERRLRPTLAILRERLLDLLAWLPLLAVALVAAALVASIGRLLAAWEAPYERISPNAFVRDLLQLAVRGAFGLAGLLLALELLDATAIVAAVAGAAGLAGLALGFAFRDLAENFIASVLLSLRQPFLPGDHVRMEGHEGRILRLTSRATHLVDLEGNHVRIPNATVFKGILLNFTQSPRRRFDFTVGVASETDLSPALAIGLDTLQQMPGILDDPPPQAWIDSLGDSTVQLHFFGWIDQRESEWAKARSEALRLVKETFDRSGILMPEPIVNVRQLATIVPSEEATPAVPVQPALEMDISRDTALDREVAEDRAEAGAEADLLDPAAPRE